MHSADLVTALGCLKMSLEGRAAAVGKRVFDRTAAVCISCGASMCARDKGTHDASAAVYAVSRVLEMRALELH